MPPRRRAPASERREQTNKVRFNRLEDAGGRAYGKRTNGRGVADAHVDYARDNRPSTGRGKWAAGCHTNALARGWFLQIVPGVSCHEPLLFGSPVGSLARAAP